MKHFLVSFIQVILNFVSEVACNWLQATINPIILSNFSSNAFMAEN